MGHNTVAVEGLVSLATMVDLYTSVQKTRWSGIESAIQGICDATIYLFWVAVQNENIFPFLFR